MITKLRKLFAWVPVLALAMATVLPAQIHVRPHTFGGTVPSGVTVGQVGAALKCVSTTGSSSSTAYTCSTTPTFTPVVGTVITWNPSANDLPNTTLTPTLAVNGAAAATIKKNAAAQPMNPWDVGLIKATSVYEFAYDGTYWELFSHTANDFSTYNNSPNNSLSAFYACLANSDAGVCRIVDNADSEHTCWLTSTCPYGPQHESNLWAVALANLMQRRGYPLYSTGIIGPISVVSTSSLFSNGVLPGITCTGTVTQVQLSGVGPQQAIGGLVGGGTLQMASGAVCTVAVSTFAATPGGTAGAFNRFRVYCAINATTGNMTVTISGQTASTACTGTNASALAQAFTVTNTAGTTALSVAITCTTGTCNLGGYEEIYTTNNFGVAIDGFEAAGGANSYWLGGAAGNTAYLKLATGTVGLVVQAIGINDAAGSIAASTVTTNMTTFAAQWPAASELIWSSFPYTGTGSAGYPAIQQAEQAWALTNLYDFLNTADNASANTSVNYWAGQQNSDFTHPTDMGAGANFAQFWIHIFGSESQAALTFGAYMTSFQNGYVQYLNSTDTSMTTDSVVCYVTGLTWCGGRRIVAASNATFQTMVQDGLVGTAQTIINGAVASIGSWGLGLSTTAGTQVVPATNFSAVADGTNHILTRPYNVIPILSNYTSSGTAGTYTNVGDGTRTMQIAFNATEFKKVHCDLTYGASATTVAAEFKWTYSGTMTNFTSSMNYNATTATAGAANMIYAPVVAAVATQQPTTPTVVNVAASNIYTIQFDVGAFSSTAGNLILTAAPSATGTVTILAGSSCQIE